MYRRAEKLPEPISTTLNFRTGLVSHWQHITLTKNGSIIRNSTNLGQYYNKSTELRNIVKINHFSYEAPVNQPLVSTNLQHSTQACFLHPLHVPHFDKVRS